MNSPYGFDPNQTTEYSPTTDDLYSDPAQGYPTQPVYPPAAPPVHYIPRDELTTVRQTTTKSRSRVVQVPLPTATPDRHAAMARASLWLGIISFVVSFVPLCGIVALFPAAMGLVFGWMGRRSPRWRRWAIAGMLLSILAIAVACSLVL